MGSQHSETCVTGAGATEQIPRNPCKPLQAPLPRVVVAAWTGQRPLGPSASGGETAAVEVAFLSVHELVGLSLGKHHFSFGFKSYGNILSPFHGGDSGDTVTLATRTSPRLRHLLAVALGGGYYGAEISVLSLA